MIEIGIVTTCLVIMLVMYQCQENNVKYANGNLYAWELNPSRSDSDNEEMQDTEEEMEDTEEEMEDTETEN